MAEIRATSVKEFLFNDGGKLYAEFNGEGDEIVNMYAEENESIDRELDITFVDKSETCKVERTVTQEGLRIEFDGSDSLFRDCNGAIFAAIKDKYADVAR